MKITEKDLVPSSFVIVNDNGNLYIGKIISAKLDNWCNRTTLAIFWDSDSEDSFFCDYYSDTVTHLVNSGKWMTAENEKGILVARLKLKPI